MSWIRIDRGFLHESGDMENLSKTVTSVYEDLVLTFVATAVGDGASVSINFGDTVENIYEGEDNKKHTVPFTGTGGDNNISFDPLNSSTTTIKDIQVRQRIADSDLSNAEAAIDIFFNESPDEWATKYILQSDIAKGFKSIEVNKPFVNSVQLRVRYFNSDNPNPDGEYTNIGLIDFCPMYAEIIYDTTATIR